MSALKRIKYPLIEVFYSIQGEGKFAFTPALFIRLGGCPVECPWCDTTYSWDASKYPSLTPDDITGICIQTMESARGALPRIIVITGGEPAYYDLFPLTEKLNSLNLPVHIETSGAFKIRGRFQWITISPKPHISDYKIPLILEENLKRANELKVVIASERDIEWAIKCEKLCNPGTSLYLQPEWNSFSVVLPLILEFIRRDGRWSLSLQHHKFFKLP